MTDTPCPFPRTYQRNAQFTPLKDYDTFAKDGDFIEVTEWYNGEGFDCHVSSQTGQQHCSWTWGEYKALVALVRTWCNDDETCITLTQPKPPSPTLMEIVALADEIEEKGLGQVDLVRQALCRWGRLAAELETDG